MAYESKNTELYARQLAAQDIIFTADLSDGSGSSSLATNVVINNGTIAATVITLLTNQPVQKCFKANVRSRATGANTVIAGVPDLSVANQISITLDATGLTDVVVNIVYSVLE